MENLIKYGSSFIPIQGITNMETTEAKTDTSNGARKNIKVEIKIEIQTYNNQICQ